LDSYFEAAVQFEFSNLESPMLDSPISNSFGSLFENRESFEIGV